MRKEIIVIFDHGAKIFYFIPLCQHQGLIYLNIQMLLLKVEMFPLL